MHPKTLGLAHPFITVSNTGLNARTQVLNVRPPMLTTSRTLRRKTPWEGVRRNIKETDGIWMRVVNLILILKLIFPLSFLHLFLSFPPHLFVISLKIFNFSKMLINFLPRVPKILLTHFLDEIMTLFLIVDAHRTLIQLTLPPTTKSLHRLPMQQNVSFQMDTT